MDTLYIVTRVTASAILDGLAWTVNYVCLFKLYTYESLYVMAYLGHGKVPPSYYISIDVLSGQRGWSLLSYRLDHLVHCTLVQSGHGGGGPSGQIKMTTFRHMCLVDLGCPPPAQCTKIYFF